MAWGTPVRRRLAVLATWGLLLPPALLAAAQLDGLLSAAASLPGSPAALAEARLRDDFASPFAEPVLVVLREAPGPDTPAGRALLERLQRRLRATPGVSACASHLDRGEAHYLSRGAPGTYLVLGLAESGPSAERRLRELRAHLHAFERQEAGRHPGLRVRLGGARALNAELRVQAAREAQAAEVRAAPWAALLLLLALRSPRAAGLALATGLAAIVLALGALAVVAAWLPLSVLARSLASMLALGLGIDYALLLVARFREGRRGGLDAPAAADEARRRTAGTLALSAAAVALGFFGLALVPVGELRSLAAGGLLAVGSSLLAATTLLPALLGLGGGRLERGASFASGRPAADTAWARWGVWVARHPWPLAVGACSGLLFLASPVRRLHAQVPGDAWLSRELEAVQALDDLRALGRSGVAGALSVVLVLPEGHSVLSAEGWQATRALAAALQADPRVEAVRSLPGLAGATADPQRVSLLPWPVKRVFVSQTGEAAWMQATPREGLPLERWLDALRALRALDAARVTGIEGARLLVGGAVAGQADYADALAGSWPRVLACVLGATFLALALAWRALLAPLKAVLLNLLSVGAALGTLVWIFQDGHGAAFLGLPGALGGLLPVVPPLVFAVVFGLSMDYEIFLVARVREARLAGAGEAEAVAAGLRDTGPTISAAAAVMTAVFAAFALGRFVPVQMLGCALAVAVLLDATLVRLALGPALLHLAGRWNWWPGLRPSVRRGDR